MDHPVSFQLSNMIVGYWQSQAIYAAAKLGIADLLAPGPQTIDALTAASNASPEPLYRLLRALASIGIFAEGPSKTFSLTPLADPLRADAPGSQKAFCLMNGGQQFTSWSEIVYSIQTGKSAYERVNGQPLFEFLATDAEQAQIFDDAMTGIHGRESNLMVDAYDFSGINILVDVGGGNGSSLIGILQHYPEMRGVLFDLPHVVERARPRIEAAGLADRCDLVGGSFFERAPSGADAYMMRHIIHDWDDQRATAILKTCHAAMSEKARLLVVESVIPPGNDPFLGKFLDLVMLVIPGGKERTAEEYRTLLAGAGFDLQRIVPSKHEISLVEARPV